MKKPLIFGLLIIITILFSGCYEGKNTPFYDSEWIMQNVDGNNQVYYHHLILNPDKTVMLRSSYFDSIKSNQRKSFSILQNAAVMKMDKMLVNIVIRD